MKLKKLFGVIGFSLLAVGTLAYNNTAEAGTGGGTGSGGTGGAGIYRQVKGKKLQPGKATTEAWDQFMRQTATNVDYQIEYIVKPLSGMTRKQVLDGCKRSELIWYYSERDGESNPSRPAHKGKQVFYDRISGNVSTKNSNFASPKPSADDRKKMFKLPDYQKLKTSWDSGNSQIVVLCSWNQGEPPVDPPKPATRDQDDVEKRTLNDGSDEFKGVVAEFLTLNPQVRQEYNSYTNQKKADWNKTHESQSKTQITPFGTWLNANKTQINNLSKLKDSAYTKEYKRLVDGAKKAQKETNKLLEIAMSDKNKKGYQDGVVINITKSSRSGGFTIGTTRNQERTITWKETCPDKCKDPNAKWTLVPGSKEIGSWRTVKTSSASANWTEESAFAAKTHRQLLSSICNKPGVDKVQGALDSPSRVKNEVYFSALNTKNYNASTKLPLGTPNSNASLNATYRDSFFNDISGCVVPDVIDCITDPAKANSSSNARLNVQNKGNKLNNTYGSQGKDATGRVTSANTFTMFRDFSYLLNDSSTKIDNRIRADIWYPFVKVGNSGITVNNAPNGKRTYFMFDPKGTPDGESVEAVINDRNYNANKMAEFSKPNYGNTSSTERNSIVNGSTVKNGKVISKTGELNEFNIRANWASDQANPHKVNISWDTPGTVTAAYYDKVTENGPVGSPITAKRNVTFGCPMKLNAISNNPPKINGDGSGSNAPSKFNNSKDAYISTQFVGSGSGLNE